MITLKSIIEVNKKFSDGKIVNKGSLEFALSHIKDSKDWIKKLAFLVRAILIDHIFKDGNKRTVATLIIYFLEDQKIAYDPYKVDEMIIKILKKNITNIEIIRRLIKDVIR